MAGLSLPSTQNVDRPVQNENLRTELHAPSLRRSTTDPMDICYDVRGLQDRCAKDSKSCNWNAPGKSLLCKRGRESGEKLLASTKCMKVSRPDSRVISFFESDSDDGSKHTIDDENLRFDKEEDPAPGAIPPHPA